MIHVAYRFEFTNLIVSFYHLYSVLFSVYPGPITRHGCLELQRPDKWGSTVYMNTMQLKKFTSALNWLCTVQEVIYSFLKCTVQTYLTYSLHRSQTPAANIYTVRCNPCSKQRKPKILPAPSPARCSAPCGCEGSAGRAPPPPRSAAPSPPPAAAPGRRPAAAAPPRGAPRGRGGGAQRTARGAQGDSARAPAAPPLPPRAAPPPRAAAPPPPRAAPGRVEGRALSGHRRRCRRSAGGAAVRPERATGPAFPAAEGRRLHACTSAGDNSGVREGRRVLYFFFIVELHFSSVSIFLLVFVLHFSFQVCVCLMHLISSNYIILSSTCSFAAWQQFELFTSFAVSKEDMMMN